MQSEPLESVTSSGALAFGFLGTVFAAETVSSFRDHVRHGCIRFDHRGFDGVSLQVGDLNDWLDQFVQWHIFR